MGGVNGHAETVSLFLKAGVDPSARDSGGKTAEVLAKEAHPHRRRGFARGSPPVPILYLAITHVIHEADMMTRRMMLLVFACVVGGAFAQSTDPNMGT